MKLSYPLSRLSLLWLLLVALLLGGCLPEQQFMDRKLKAPESAFASHRRTAAAEAPAPPGPAPALPASDRVAPAGGPEYQALPGLKYQAVSGDWAEPLKKKFSRTREVAVAVDNMPLNDFIHYLFGEVFGLNYVVDSRVQKVKEPVTLNLSRQVTEYQLFVIAADVLKQHHLAIHVKEGVYYIWKDDRNREFALGIGARYSDIPATMGEIQQLIPIKYADARNLLQLLPKGTNIKVLSAARENLLLVTGSRDQVVQVLNMVRVLDRPAMRGRYVGMLYLHYWGADEMVKKLQEVLTQEGIPVASKAGRSGVYFNTLERWGAIIFFAAEKFWIDRVRFWAELLDVPSDWAAKRYFLYFPENSRAGELAESLGKIIGISHAEGSVVSGTLSEAAPAPPPAGASPAPPGVAPAAPAETAGSPGSLLIDDGEVRIAVDEHRNALIVYATPNKYAEIEELLKRLDTMPLQVLIEASIVEVTLTDDLQYGLEWYLRNSDNGQTSIIRTLGGLGLGSGGLNFSLITDSRNFMVTINALAQKNMVKLLQSPTVTVRDGKSVSMIVGTDVPIITSEATSPDIVNEGSTGIIRSVEYRSTGVSLQVTPSVHARGVVSMEIAQEVSEAQTNNTSDISSPIILRRSIATDVVAGDGQTVLIGGLIRENDSRGVNGIPFLEDIPVLGYLFKTNTTGAQRTELVIMITPHIIENTEQIDDMRKAVFESFKNLE